MNRLLTLCFLYPQQNSALDLRKLILRPSAKPQPTISHLFSKMPTNLISALSKTQSICDSPLSTAHPSVLETSLYSLSAHTNPLISVLPHFVDLCLIAASAYCVSQSPNSTPLPGILAHEFQILFDTAHLYKPIEDFTGRRLNWAATSSFKI